jgi:hypothetical protein
MKTSLFLLAIVLPMCVQAQVYYVPVVFHVVYANEEQNVSDEQIRLQLQVISEDFSMTNADAGDTRTEFKSVAASADIQFYLADLDDAVTRTSTTHGPFVNDDLHKTASGGKDGYHTDEYLNVWVANLTPDLFGYGSAPGTDAFKDGVAIHYQYFGKDVASTSNYSLGRTLTHEIGHWLSLQHPWGTKGDCETDDGLTDTPAQSGPAAGCDLDQNSCGGLNMVQNFMNTSYDRCMTLFTKQQSDLMRTTLTTLRANVYSTVPPVITGLRSENDGVIIYPNPVTSNHYVYLRSNDSEINITITDMVGRIVRRERSTLLSNELAIALRDLSNGVYVVRVKGAKTNHTEKIYVNLN